MGVSRRDRPRSQTKRTGLGFAGRGRRGIVLRVSYAMGRDRSLVSNTTKWVLEESLKKLLLSKPFGQITDQMDLTTDCGISRMTFYYHFQDIRFKWSGRVEDGNVLWL